MLDRISKYIHRLREHKEEKSTVYALQRASLDAFNGLNFTITSRRPLGTNVFSKNWDILIVLDACRVDATREVADRYDFIDEVRSIWSVGSSSHEWTVQTFSQKYIDEINKTALLSTNPFSIRTFEGGETPPYESAVPIGSLAWNPVTADDFAYFEMMSNSDPDLSGTVPPWKATDRAIYISRTFDVDRLIVHYFQPHRPFFTRTSDPMEESSLAYDRPYEKYDTGELSYSELWTAYIENLCVVLDCIGVLVENVNADRLAITADHGQLIGEFGLTGHPEGVPHPAIKRVPWIETSASDEKTYSAISDEKGDPDNVEERLSTLGYI